MENMSSWCCPQHGGYRIPIDHFPRGNPMGKTTGTRLWLVPSRRDFSIDDWDPKHQLEYIPSVYRTYIYIHTYIHTYIYTYICIYIHYIHMYSRYSVYCVGKHCSFSLSIFQVAFEHHLWVVDFEDSCSPKKARCCLGWISSKLGRNMQLDSKSNSPQIWSHW
jgi:hypothetical protein